MPTTQGNRQILDQKRWEWVTPAPVANVAGACVNAADNVRQAALFVVSNSAAYLYQPDSDGWTSLPNPGLSGTFGAGAAVTSTNWSAGPTAGAVSIAATGGTTTTIATTLTLARSLNGYRLFVMSGPNAGATIEILRNTVGANSTITVPAQASAFSASTTFRLLTPRWFALTGGNTAGWMRFYDYATNTWTSIATTGAPAAVNVDSGMTCTPSWRGSGYVSFGNGTSSGTNTSTTLNDTTTSWTASQWINYQVRISAGTGAGQIRTISASTSTSLTVSVAWTVTPDATSVYSIEGNDDFLYLKTAGTGVMYRYSMSGNAMTALANSGQGSVGFELLWADSSTDASWGSENAIVNGRRIYAPRGSAISNIDYYDIPSNTWVQPISYAPATDTFNTGSSFTFSGGYIYALKEATGRAFRLNVATSEMEGWTQILYTQGASTVGNRAWMHYYRDGATTIPFVHFMGNSQNVTFRQMVY